jgi:PAS domain-containing protein
VSADAFDVAQLALLGEAAECLQDVAVFVWDDDRNYVAVNRSACALLARTREQILRMKVGDLTPDRASPLFQEVQHGGVHTGLVEFEGGRLRFVTCPTRVAGLPYMVSVCWQDEAG